MNADSAKKIGMQIWNNEASGRRDLLVFWNQYESFPSLGIGHCIWYPEGQTGKFTEQFPQLCFYLKENNIQLPDWLEQAILTGAPWPSRNDFLRDIEHIEELTQLLELTIDLQILFMVERLEQRLPLIIEAVPDEKKEQIIYNIELLKSSDLGLYALIDYLNSKGDGLNPLEESRGDRWGLLQVLLDMPDNLNQDNITKAFTVSAAKILLRLIQNSAPDYRRVKFLNGWMKRVSTYADQNIFKS